MDFSFLCDMNRHPIERLITQDDLVPSKVKGMAHNVYFFKPPSTEVSCDKFGAFLYTYLRLQGMGNGRVVVITMNKEQATALQSRILRLSVFKTSTLLKCSVDETNVMPFYDFTLGKQVEVYIVSMGNDAVDDDVLDRFSLFLDLAARDVRSGMYVIGDPSIFAKRRKLQDLLGCLKMNKKLGSSILLQCPRHKRTLHRVKRNADFPILAGNFCYEACGQKLKCGHACQQLCHFDEHTDYPAVPCFQICGRVCSNNHTCSQVCHSTCPPCVKIMTKVFDCGHRVTYECSALVPKTCGSVKQRVRGLCGHEINIDCESGEKPRCRKEIHQSLICGHSRTIECYRGNEPCMEETYMTRLKCGHRMYFRCNESSEDKLKQPCNSQCSRTCRRGHLCVDHPCGDPCPPCQREAWFKFGNCGHSLTTMCNQGDSKNARVCNKNCDRTRTCGHPCGLPCAEHKTRSCPPCQVIVTTERDCGHYWVHPCSTDDSEVKCLEWVDVQDLAACGHGIEMQCYDVDELQDGEAIFFCKSQCNFYFDPAHDGCGHYCGGICMDCAYNVYHHVCLEKCQKIKFCGHRCKSRCASPCPPCDEVCEYSCAHGRCQHLCGLPCEPCKEPCTYECPHGKCTAECGQKCNKLPCEQNCPLRLSCGHTCAGFCGEPCPPLCSVCDKNQLLEEDLLGKDTICAKDRFVLLVDCGHVIDSEALRSLMTITPVEREILVKKCPICRKEIRNCSRFKNELLKCRDDLNSIRMVIYGSPTVINDLQNETCSNLKKVVQNIHFQFLRHQIESTLCSCEYLLGIDKELTFRQMGLHEAQSLCFVSTIFLKLQSLQEELSSEMFPDSIADDISHYIKMTTDFLTTRPWPLTSFEMRNVAMEWDRLRDLTELAMKKSTNQHEIIKRLLRQRRGKTAFDRAYHIVTAYGKEYDGTSRTKLKEALKELEVALDCKIGIPDEERLNILKAFNFSSGRWFKCPNGHIYVVTECGGVTEEGLCNECGAKVGGGNHSVLPTNELASEMDGAAAPLYPTALERSS